jgi:hypothetical protein
MESLEHTYPGTIGYLVVPLLLNTWWSSEWHTPQWVIWKVTSSGPGILLQQTWVFSHDESLFTDMENLWHSSLAEPNKKKHEEREPKKFPTCAWIWWAPTALSHHVLHILCNPLGTLQIISPTSKACYRVELLLSTMLSMFVTNMDLSWKFAIFKFKAIQGRKMEMETPKRDLSIYLFINSCVFLLFWMLYQSIETNFLTCFCTTKPQDSSSCSLSDSNPISSSQLVDTQHTTDGIIPRLGNYLCNQCHSFWVPKNH